MSRHHRHARMIGGVIALAAIAVWIAVPAAADPTSKPYAADVSPHVVPAGATRTLTISLTNETDTQQLGSANVIAPATFTLLGASSPAPGGTASITGSTIELRGLSTPPGATTQVSVQVIAPCTPGDYAWETIAKQSNNYSGEPGNNLFFDAANSDLVTTVSGTCRLGFDFLRGPADAQVSTNITSVRYTPAGLPVQVRVLDAAGDLITTSSASVTLSIGNGPAGATLSGATTQAASSGIATFPTLSIDRTALDYTLVASTSSGSIDPGASGPFDIVDVGKNCPAGPCSSGNVVNGNTTATETASAGASGDQLTLAVSVEPLDCPGYTEVSAVVTFDVTGIRTKTVTITVPKSVAGSPKSRQVCYSAPTPFVDRSGNLVTTGLLPDCTAAAAPCKLEAKVVKKQVQVTLLAPAGDPKGRV
jgi:hypothetical protein